MKGGGFVEMDQRDEENGAEKTGKATFSCAHSLCSSDVHKWCSFLGFS